MEQENKELLEKRAEYNRLFKAQDYFYVRAASKSVFCQRLPLSGFCTVSVILIQPGLRVHCAKSGIIPSRPLILL